MKHSFEGIGQWAATFTCGGEVSANHVVKISGNETVSPCVAGDAFCGVTVFVGRDGEACSVALGGMVTTTYTGGVPALGWGGLSADGNGGVQVDSAANRYRVVDVDESAGLVTFAL